jgi:hypothetical protein
MDPLNEIHLLSLFSPFFSSLPVLQVLLSHPIWLHAHHSFLYKQHLDSQRDFFQQSLPRTFSKLPFNLTEKVIVFYGELNNVSLLYSSKQEVDCSSPLIIQRFQSIDHSLSQTSGSRDLKAVLMEVCLFNHSYSKHGKLDKEKRMQINIDIPLFPTFNVGYQTLGFLLCKVIFLRKYPVQYFLLRWIPLILSLHHAIQNLQVPTTKPFIGSLTHILPNTRQLMIHGSSYQSSV